MSLSGQSLRFCVCIFSHATSRGTNCLYFLDGQCYHSHLKLCFCTCHITGQANSEVSALLGRIPSAVGYQPTLATDLGGLQERITTTQKGSITSVQAIYVPADDLTDPAPATTFAHLDATTVLSRQVSSLRRKFHSLYYNRNVQLVL